MKKRRMNRPMTVVRNRLSGWLFLLIALILVAAWPGQPGQAQTLAPTPTNATVSAVARAGGAALWDAGGGTLITVAAPGERLTATARSADGAWLYLQSAAGATGWAARDELLIFNVEVLPVEAVTITPATPTPIPTPTPGEAEPESEEQAITPQTTAAAPAATDGEGLSVTVSNVRLNIRGGPGTNYPVIGAAAPGQALVAQGRNEQGDWLQIMRPDTGGYGWVAASYVTSTDPLTDLPVVAAPAVPAAPATASTSPQQAASAAPAPAGVQGKLVIQTSYGGPIYLYDFATGSLRQLTSGFDPALSPDGSMVAFTRSGGEQGLYAINVDGSGERLVFGERQSLISPKWSPDGSQILFVRGDYSWKCKDHSERMRRYNCRPAEPGDGPLPELRETRPRLAVVDLDGNNYRDIASLDTASAPDWTSAGIVYASEAGIQTTSPTSQDANRLVYFDVLQRYYQDPDWQPRPDGSPGRIVLQQRRAGRWDLFTVNPDGSGFAPLIRPATVLVDEMPSNVSPAWSPDGRHIVFLSNRTPENSAGAWGVWIMDADGGNQRRLPIDLPFEYTFVEEQMLDWGP
ncbi:MAG: hypothetical protein DCC55_08940 [Chloroflexi bacterium]|nr:MAG: hypothetical protein DCC55_08940 [Chloroflexota bacterium]